MNPTVDAQLLANLYRTKVLIKESANQSALTLFKKMQADDQSGRSYPLTGVGELIGDSLGRGYDEEDIGHEVANYIHLIAKEYNASVDDVFNAFIINSKEWDLETRDTDLRIFNFAKSELSREENAESANQPAEGQLPNLPVKPITFTAAEIRTLLAIMNDKTAEDSDDLTSRNYVSITEKLTAAQSKPNPNSPVNSKGPGQ